MGPIIAALVVIQGQVPNQGDGQMSPNDPAFMARRSAANNKFRKFLASAKTLSVQMEIKQAGNPVAGHAEFVLARPGNLYYHLTWGKDDYTYTILNGHATEIDQRTKAYDEYATPGWSLPEANISTWIDSFFPSIFISEQILLPPKSFDETGHLLKYGIGSGEGSATKKNVVTFSNYKLNAAYPDSKFKLTVPAGLVAFSTPRPAPPIAIDENLPNLKLVGSNGKATDLMHAMAGKSALVAFLDPSCPPSASSLSALKAVKGTRVLVLNADPKGAGLKADGLPIYHDPQGHIATAVRAPMSPLFYLVDGKGKVAGIWYGYDRNNPKRFADQVTAAVAEMHG